MTDRFNVIIEVDPGDYVICDFCVGEYTNSPDSGGFVLLGWAVCPACAPETAESVRKNGEEPPEAVCPDGVSFADFIRAYRRGA